MILREFFFAKKGMKMMKTWRLIFACMTVLLPAPFAITAEEIPSPPGPDYAYVFENPEILTFDIEMSADNFQTMQPEQTGMMIPGTTDKMSSRSMFGMKFNYASATVKCGGEVYTGVGIRHRGNASMVMIPDGAKRPYKFDFDRFNERQSFHGFKKLNFINSFRDPSRLRDKLTYDLMRKVGVPAPRASFAHLYLTVNEKPREYLGFYVAVEQVNDTFLRDRFGNSDGLLIKGEILNDLEYRGADWEAYAHDYELKSSKETSEPSLLIKFLKFVCQASDEEFAAGIGQRLNVDRFLACVAVYSLLSDLDSYAGLGHNWYLYYNTEMKRFEYIPWDVNEAFGNLQITGKQQQMIDYDIYRPYVSDKVLIRRLLAIDEYNALYLKYLREFADGAFAPEMMNAEIDRLRAYIQDAVKNDAHVIFSTGAFEKSGSETVEQVFPVFSEGIIGLKPFIAKRIASVKAQLAGAKKGYSFEGFQRDLIGMPSEPEGPDGENEPGKQKGAEVLNELIGTGGSAMPPPPPQTEETAAKKKALEDKLKEIEAAIEKAPDDPNLYVQKGQIMGQLIQMGGMMERMKYGMQLMATFEKAVELDPENPGARLGRGTLRFFIPEGFGGDPEGAKSDFQFVLEKEPNNGEAIFFMGLYNLKQGEIDKAKSYFEKILELDPNNQQAKAILEKLK